MTENLDSLVLEHLRHIRGKVDQIADDVSEVRIRHKHKAPVPEKLPAFFSAFGLI